MIRFFLSFFVASLMCLNVSYGAIVYSFDQAGFTVNAGGTVDVDVYLEQTGGDTILTDDGLFGYGVRLLFNTPPIPSDPAAVLAESDILANPAFDDAAFATVELISGESAGASGSVLDPFSPLVGSRILLGTFTFTGGNTVGEVTNLTATDFSGLDETISGLGTPLDSMVQDGFATITVTAVPEPSSILILFAGGVAAIMRRRRFAAREVLAA